MSVRQSYENEQVVIDGVEWNIADGEVYEVFSFAKTLRSNFVRKYGLPAEEGSDPGGSMRS